MLFGLPELVMHNSDRRQSVDLAFCMKNENEGEFLCTLISLQESQQTVLEVGAGAQHQAPPPVPTSHFSTLQFQPTIVPQHPRSPSAAAAASLTFPIVQAAAPPVANKTGTAPRMVEDNSSVAPPVVVKTRNHDFLTGKPMQLPTSNAGSVVASSGRSKERASRAVVVLDRGGQQDDQNDPEEQLGNSSLSGVIHHIPTKELAVVQSRSSSSEAWDDEEGERLRNGDRQDHGSARKHRDAAGHVVREDVLHEDASGRDAPGNNKMNLAAVLLEEEFNNNNTEQLAGEIRILQQPKGGHDHQGVVAQHRTIFETAPLDEKENSKEREAGTSHVSSATFSKAVKLPAMNQFCFYQEPPPCVAASGTTSSEHIHFSDEIALPLPENLEIQDNSSSSSIVSNSEMVKNNMLISIPVPVDELGDSEKEEQEGELSEDPRQDGLGAEVKGEVVHDIEECNKNLLRNYNASGVKRETNASSVSGAAGAGGGACTQTSTTQGQCNYTVTVGDVDGGGNEAETGPFAAQQDRREDVGTAGNYKRNKFVVAANKNSGTSDKKQNAILRINASTTRTRVQSPTTAAAAGSSWTPSVAKEPFVPQHTQDQYFEQTLRSPTSTPSNLTPGFGTHRSSKANHSRAAAGAAVPAFNNPRSRRASSVDKLVADRVEQEDLAPPTPTSTSEREMKARTTSTTTTTERIKQNAKPVLVKISLSKQIEKSAKLRNQLEQQLVEIERLKQKTEVS